MPRGTHFATAVLAGFLVAISLWPLVARADAGSNDAVITQLKNYVAVIEQRERIADALYARNTAAKALAAQFAKANISSDVSGAFSEDWAGWLASDFVSGSENVYGYHRKTLIKSIDALAAGASADADELKAISRGMDTWISLESDFVSLVGENAGLLVQQGQLLDQQKAVKATDCGNDNSCDLAKSTAIRQLDDAYDVVAQHYADNAAAIRQGGVELFSPIAAATPICSEMAVSFTSDRFTYRDPAVGIVSFSPPGCQEPDAPIAAVVAKKQGDIDPAINIDELSIRVSISTNQAGSVTVKATRGDLEAEAKTLQTDKVPKCDGMDLILDAPKVHLNDARYLRVIFKPDDCDAAELSASFSSSNSSVVEIRDSGPLFASLYASGVGTSKIQAISSGLPNAVKYIDVKNDGEPCKSMEVSYPGALDLRVGSETRPPRLAYTPNPCMIPDGKPIFDSLTPKSLSVDGKSGIAAGVSPGPSQVGVQHQGLGAEAKINVVQVPVCDWASLKYPHDELVVGDTERPNLTLTATSDRSTDLTNCLQPNEPGRYTSSSSEIATVVDGGDQSGLVRAIRSGTTTISFSMGDTLKATAEITVVAKQHGN